MDYLPRGKFLQLQKLIKASRLSVGVAPLHCLLSGEGEKLASLDE
ncbi:unnamed protein product, partial [marine sediment metagenome]